jgi:NADPH-dependent ferric siderophore reductase
MDEPDRTASLALAERIGAQLFDLQVEEASALTPSIRRLRLGAVGLGALDPEPGQDLMLAVPSADGTPVRRRYTIRAHDPLAETVVLDIVLHGEGPGARWAADAATGDTIEAIGPRGKVLVKPEASWHLFVGDESFLPAAFTMAESLAATPAIVVLEIGGPGDEVALNAPACAAGPHWVHRSATTAGTAEALGDALSDLALPPGRGHAYVGGEFHQVAAVRSHLAGRGLAPDQISAKAYWRSGSANASHGEPNS